MREIWIYVEGGGVEAWQQAGFRTGFDTFLSEMKSRALDNDFEWHLVASGPRPTAYKWFLQKLAAKPDANVLLLVDSERPVTKPAHQHLAEKKDEWELDKSLEDQLHLMVECMEAWLIEDLDALNRFYGEKFDRGKFETADVRKRRKNAVITALEAASRRTPKGKYGKLTHGPDLLAVVDTRLVRKGAVQCERLFAYLQSIIK